MTMPTIKDAERAVRLSKELHDIRYKIDANAAAPADHVTIGCFPHGDVTVRMDDTLFNDARDVLSRALLARAFALSKELESMGFEVPE